MKKLLIIFSCIPFFTLAQGPTANFSANNACLGDPTTLTDLSSSSGTITTCYWDIGQETPYRKNTPLFFIYGNGTVEKTIIIE